MIILYIFDLIFFIIRLSVVSHDISKNLSDRRPFLVPILIFDLIASVPVIIANILYLIMRHCVQTLRHDNHSLTCPWHFATLTCFRFHCHKDRPQGILLMRILIIGCSFFLKFMCFIIGASCSSRFQTECTAYTVIAAFALVVSIGIIVIEFINYFRLWRYNPTDTRNGNINRAYTPPAPVMIKKTHRGFLGFIHHSLLNDYTAENFRESRCKEEAGCKSKSLHHYLFYHSLDKEQKITFETLNDIEKRSFIALYRTTEEEALKIAQNGFPYGEKEGPHSRDHLILKKSIFFTRSREVNLESKEAIICARLNLGRIHSLINDENLHLNKYFAYNDGKYDTIYIESTHRFYLRMPGQIEKWIITLNETALVNDLIDGTLYQPCI